MQVVTVAEAVAAICLQYNTCFWALVKSGKTPTEAQAALKVSV